MAKQFQYPTFETVPACLFLADFTEAKELSEFLKTRPQWEKLHDRVMSEFRQPWIALVWRAYKPGMIAEQDVMLDIFGVTLITPIEAREMRETKQRNSFLNKTKK